MPNPAFKVVIGPGDWGSPLSDEATFDTLEEAQAAAHEFMQRQRQGGRSEVPLRVVIEETRLDGSSIKHSVG